jgi:hypothetical protein
MMERKISVIPPVVVSGSIPNCESCQVHQGTVHCDYCSNWICGICSMIDRSDEKPMTLCRKDKGCYKKRKQDHKDGQETHKLCVLSTFSMLFLFVGMYSMIRWIQDTTNTGTHNLPLTYVCIIVPLLLFIPICSNCIRLANKT